MPTWNELRGLKSSDRTQEEQRAINQQMGYKDSANNNPIKIKPTQNVAPVRQQPLSTTGALMSNILTYQNQLNDQYANALAGFREQYGTSRNSINGSAEDYINKVGSQFSSYYKKYRGTDKLPLNNQQYKELAAQYAARKQTYGEDDANQWLDGQFKDIVGENQSWYEQALNGIGHLMPAIEGGAIQAAGNIYGIARGVAGLVNKDLDLPRNEDLNGWDNFWNNVIDNPVTRYGADVEHSGASYVGQGITNLLGINDESVSERIARTKATATKYNPEGIGSDQIVTTSDQDASMLSSATPWQALYSGGFTALSMFEGAGLAKAGQWLFKGLSNVAKLAKKGEALERTLKNIRRVQNATEPFVISGIVGSGEGAVEGLQTKKQVEQEGVNKLDDFYKEKVAEEAKELYESNINNPYIEVRTDQGKTLRRKYATPDEAYQAVWDKYKDQYTDSRRQIDWAASKAGVQNFWANSLINGMINSTLKAGLAAPRVQEALRNNRLTGWAYRKPKFTISDDNVVTPKMSKLSSIKQVLKEPFGEGLEEYQQSLSNDMFSGAAENNINEFIKNRFDGDGTAKIGDSFASDWSAAGAALKNSLTDTESIQSAILGAVSSSMGTVAGIGRGYHRDESGNLVQNKWYSPRNLIRGYNSNGEKESWLDYAGRVTPWRSGLVNAIFDRGDEIADAKETAATLTEWLQDPTNQAKWDGLVGTANWMTQMEKAAGSNDEFSYRKAQMGKAINDVFMLSKLKGTDFYDSVIEDLQRVSEMDVDSEVTQQMIQKIRERGGEDYQDMSDEEIVSKIQSNANKMLGLMSNVESESKDLDRLFGRMDEDTKQSLIYGKLMEKDFGERRDELGEEIKDIKSGIKTSRQASHAAIDNDLKKLIMKYGSVHKAVHAQQKLEEQKDKASKKVEELEAIDKDKRSDKQNDELKKSKDTVKKLDEQLKGFDGIYEKDDKGKSTGKIDAGLLSMVLNEQEIMDLDPVTRAMVLAQGADKLYNATHQDRQAIDKVNREIDEIDRQIDKLTVRRDGWRNPEDGSVKKHHNKQVQKADAAIEDLQRQKDKKLRELSTLQGDMKSKPVYSDAQQQVIDNLIQQGQERDKDFLDKVVDMGRLEKGIKDYHTQYQAILADPNVFKNYVMRTKFNAARDLTRRRTERVANIDNYEEYAQEVDKLTANASQLEVNDIYDTLRKADARQKQYRREQWEKNRIANWKDESDGQLTTDEETGEVKVEPQEEESYVEPESNFDRYKRNAKEQASLIEQFVKNPNLTDNDQSLLLDAMQYLQSKGVDVKDQDAAVQTLLERDDEGNMGGKFRQYVEAKNNERATQQRAFMPTYTSIGQIVSQYVELLNGSTDDAINRGNANPVIVDNPTGTTDNTSGAVVQEESEHKEGTTNGGNNPFWEVSSATPEADGKGNVEVENGGTVSTDAQTKIVQEQSKPKEEKTDEQVAFEKVTSPEIAKLVTTIMNNFIDNSNASDEAKDLAKQYFMDIAVNAEENYSTLEDILPVIQSKINDLNQQAAMQESESNQFSQAQGILRKIYASLNAKVTRGETGREKFTQKQNPNGGWIHTANISYMRKKNPDSWAVTFTDQHRIDEWNRDHYPLDPKNTVIYFITDSDWSGEVMRQMNNADDSRDYETYVDMPIVAAVKVDAPTDTNNTTAIEVNGQWYQPIGIMPSTVSTNSGAANTAAIRRLASQKQGRHLVTSDGMPNGSPLTTRFHGVNYITGNHPDDTDTKRNNTKDNNTDVTEDILQSVAGAEYLRLKAMSREDMLKDKVYRDARSKFLNGLSWDNSSNSLVYTPDRLRTNGSASPMKIFAKKMAETIDRNTGKKTLKEVLESGSLDDVVNFNSRTQRLYDEVIRPLFLQTLDDIRKHHEDRSAQVVTQNALAKDPQAYQHEAERMTKILNGDKSIKGLRRVDDFIYVSSGWKLSVTAPVNTADNPNRQVAGTKEDSSTTYNVYLTNDDTSVEPIKLGEIHAGQSDSDAAKQVLKNFLYDENAHTVRDFLNWQRPKSDAQDINNEDTKKSERARENYGNIIDDGILDIAGSSIVYDIVGVKLNNPISMSGGKPRIIYQNDTVSNPTNAQPSSPVNNSPQAEGGAETKDGEPVEPNSGADLGEGKGKNNSPSNPPAQPQKSKAEKDAEKLVEKIVADSKEFTLFQDETYYYITDKNTGERIKYLRVTTVIGADVTAPDDTMPTKDEIIAKLKESHTLPNLSKSQISFLKDIESFSKSLGVSESEVRRAVAELRTEKKKTKYGAWGTPSTALGNTADAITRDFLAGHLKDSYPNISKENLDKFVQQLTLFKNDCDSNGIHLVSEGVMAHGHITMTAKDGTTHEVNVAGTLDLFGYDTKGNFYIFDMKTTRDHSKAKLENEKAKWSRQVSMYADLLKQTYGINVDPKNLRIIPINVSYPAPIGKGKGLNPGGPKYDVTPEGQLTMAYRNKEPKNFIAGENGENEIALRATTVKGQYPPGYTKFNIDYDRLSSEDQDIAEALSQQSTTEEKPKSATIETPQEDHPSFINGASFEPLQNFDNEEQSPTTPPTAPPIVPSGQKPLLPSWDELDDEIWDVLDKQFGITSEDEYNKMLSENPTKAASIRQRLKCMGLL